MQRHALVPSKYSCLHNVDCWPFIAIKHLSLSLITQLLGSTLIMISCIVFILTINVKLMFAFGQPLTIITYLLFTFKYNELYSKELTYHIHNNSVNKKVQSEILLAMIGSAHIGKHTEFLCTDPGFEFSLTQIYSSLELLTAYCPMTNSVGRLVH